MFDKRISIFIFITIMITAMLVSCVKPDFYSQRPNFATSESYITKTPSRNSTDSLSTPSLTIGSTTIPGQTPSPFLTSTITQIPQPTSIPTIPTLPFEKEINLINALQTTECLIPCYLGITPGKTSLAQANVILENFGGNKHEPFHRLDGSIEYNYDLWVGDSAFPVDTPEPNGDMVKIVHTISIITDNNTVQIMKVYLVITKSNEKFQEYWSRYSPREIIIQTGLPDDIYMEADSLNPRNLNPFYFFVYKELGARILFSGIKSGELICPQYKGRWVHLSLEFYDPQSEIALREGLLSIRDEWIPIDEILKVKKIDFYDQVLSDPEACFEPKSTSP